jgi:hypothetical protein
MGHLGEDRDWVVSDSRYLCQAETVHMYIYAGTLIAGTIFLSNTSKSRNLIASASYIHPRRAIYSTGWYHRIFTVGRTQKKSGFGVLDGGPGVIEVWHSICPRGHTVQREQNSKGKDVVVNVFGG